MSLPLVLSLVWLAIANVIGMIPSRHKHWPQAYVLMATGAPLLVWVFVHDGWVFGSIIALCAASILRWPIRFFVRWLRGLIAPPPGSPSN